jgi:ferritin-like metal-binding protein YciE
MAAAAHTTELRSRLMMHLSQTRRHAEKLREILGGFGRSTTALVCPQMQALVRAGHDQLDLIVPAVRDMALIISAQRIEHFEMAGYQAAKTMARLLGYTEVAAELDLIEQQETIAEQALAGVAASLRTESADGPLAPA